jgi:sirohydrochlorin ferrochelatase
VSDVSDFPAGLPARRPGRDTPLQHQPQPEPPPPPPEDFPVRQPHARLVQPGGRHRRAMPASLPEGAPALILAVPSVSDDGLSGPTADIAAVLRVDNSNLDVRTARINHGGRGDPAGIRAVLADAAARRPAGAPSAVIVPQLVTPHPESFRTLREAIAATGVNAHIGEVFNTNALLAEALHHRLADAGLARADRVRMFSITTSADGIILLTVGGEEAVGTASVTAVLLAARLALPVLAASLDAKPSVEEAAARLEDMGVSRIALAPCVIGPEADPAAIEGAAAAVGAKCAAPLGAHGNVVKLISRAYGQVLSQLETPPTVLGPPLAIRGTAAGQLAGRTAPMGVPGW